MLIFIASNGRSLEVGVEPSTRVATLMETLTGALGVVMNDQILMCDGERLDANKLLANYFLPGSSASTKDVFLYNKSHLRLHGPSPEEEVMQDLEATASSDEDEGGLVPAVVPLQGASPLHRVLYQYNEDFRAHLKVAQRATGASKRYHQHCLDLVSEMEVQSKAIDSARTSVEAHYTHMHSQLHAFNNQYNVQRSASSSFLAGFDEEMEAMASVQLHPAVQTDTQKVLLDLVPAAQLKSWASECRAFHQNLEQKVAGLDVMFEGLRSEVEAVFMEAPSVNLEALAIQSGVMGPKLEEMVSMEQVLENDCGRIQTVLEGERQSAQKRSSMPSAIDSCSLMETVHENHVNHLMPRTKDIHEEFQAFYQQCVTDKNQMIKDVTSQLRRISSQQTRIQGLRNKLSAFREAARKEADMLQHLLVVRRTCAGYRQCLAECMRRQAFSQLYASQAEQMAERMGKLRDKEQSKRESFALQISSIIPKPTLAVLGLLDHPQHCQISLPPAPSGLAQVSVSDIQAVPLAAAQPLIVPSGSKPLVIPTPVDNPEQEDTVEPSLEPDRDQELEIDNAKLRIEVAQLHAQLCSLGLASASGRGGDSKAPGQAVNQPKFEAQKWQTAMTAQKDLISRLEQELAATRLQSSAYASRALKLEVDLEQRSIASESKASQPAKPSALVQPGTEVPAKEGTPEHGEEQAQQVAALPLTPISTSPDQPQLSDGVKADEETVLDAALGSHALQGRQQTNESSQE